MSTGDTHTAGGNPAMNWHPIHGGVIILPVASCYDKTKAPDVGTLVGSCLTLPLPYHLSAAKIH